MSEFIKRCPFCGDEMEIIQPTHKKFVGHSSNKDVDPDCIIGLLVFKFDEWQKPWFGEKKKEYGRILINKNILDKMVNNLGFSGIAEINSLLGNISVTKEQYEELKKWGTEDGTIDKLLKILNMEKGLLKTLHIKKKE